MFLTPEAINRARSTKLDGVLDFTADVLPLIHSEVENRDLTDDELMLVRRCLGGQPEMWADYESFRARVTRDALADLAEAELGRGVSVLKEALEVLRDHRSALRAAVDEPGLTPAGHRAFFSYVPGVANHVAVGPQLERIQEIVALQEAGLIELGPGPSPVVWSDGAGWVLESTMLEKPAHIKAHYLIAAHLRWPALIRGCDVLRPEIASWAAPHQADPRYLRLTGLGQVVMRDGQTADGVVVLGPPAEGANYYNNYILWPGIPSPMLEGVDSLLYERLRTV